MPKLFVAVLLFGIWAAPASAATPAPSMPLPPCVSGQGACGQTDPLVTGTAAGNFTAGGTVLIKTVPAEGVCDSMSTYTYIWSPSGCYMAVSAPAIVTCAFIDLADGRFRELPCAQALYRNTSTASAPLFTQRRPAGNTDATAGSTCGASPSYSVYVYGGPSTVPEAVWSARGPKALDCELTFNGPRPDGMYGPTWVKLRVGIGHGENGLGPGGTGKSSEIYVPIEGDLRGTVDVRVLATHTLSSDEDGPLLTLHMVVENQGELPASSVNFLFTAPPEIHTLQVQGANCTIAPAFSGGNTVCTFALPGRGDASGQNTKFFDIATRVINASDLNGRLTFRATTANDAVPANNEASTNVQLNLRPGNSTQTMQMLDAIERYFDYKTPDNLLDKQCNEYMDDIFERLSAIRVAHPEAFRDLAFARVTSGTYILPIVRMNAGHVGVVVYPKGTNYHESGVIIHGTPTWSPTDLDADSGMGTRELGYHTSVNVFREGTADHGLYYRTPIAHFPGAPNPEGPIGCGMEGVYTDNVGKFPRGTPADCVKAPVPTTPANSCPFYPDAVLVRTQSPVDIRLTNSRGQRVQTTGNQITMQELDSSIFSFTTPHADGSTGWTLVLPKDVYSIDLVGTGTGPYRLTMRTYDTAGKAVDRVVDGTTLLGRTDAFTFDGSVTPVAQPPAGTGGGTGGGTGAGGGTGTGTGGVAGGGAVKGGGGALDAALLAGLAALLALAVARRRSS